MKLYKIITNTSSNKPTIPGPDVDLIEYFSIFETKSLVDINRYLSKYGYPLFNNEDINRLKMFGSSLMYSDLIDNKRTLTLMIDIEHPSNDFLHKRIIRDQKIKKVLNETK